MKFAPILALLVISLAFGTGWFLRNYFSQAESEMRGLKESLAQRESALSNVEDRLVAAIKEKTELIQKNQVLEKICGALPEGFTDASVLELLDAPGQMQRMQAMMAKIQSMTPEEIKETLAEMTKDFNQGFDMERVMGGYLMLSRLGSEDFEGAISFLATQDNRILQSAGTALVLATLASESPEKALAYLANDGADIFYRPEIADFAAQAIAKELARNDFDKALNWAKDLPRGAKGGALSALLTGVLTEDPAKAARIASELPDGSERTRAIRDVTEGWAARDPNAAFAWVNAMPDGAEKDEAKEKLLSGWARSDPAGAVQHIDQLVGEEKQGTAMKIVARRWSEQDPLASAAWVAQQPDGDDKTRALADATKSLARKDPQQASLFLLEQPAGTARDSSIVAMVETISAADPESGMTWLTDISDPQTRTRELEAQTSKWLKEDESAATAWIESTPKLSAAEKISLLTKK